jgi:hypothetical protein
MQKQKKAGSIDPAFPSSPAFRHHHYCLSILAPPNPTRPMPRSSMAAGFASRRRDLKHIRNFKAGPFNPSFYPHPETVAGESLSVDFLHMPRYIFSAVPTGNDGV